MSHRQQTNKRAQQLRRQATKVVLGVLLADLRQGPIDTLTSLGFTIHQLLAIQQLRLQDLDRLETLSGGWLDLSINHERLDRALENLAHSIEEEPLINALLKRGASYEMMRELCGLTPNDIVTRRRALGLPISVGGRSRLPDEATRENLADLWRQWAAEEPCERRRYLRLADASGLPLASLWALIKGQAAT